MDIQTKEKWGAGSNHTKQIYKIAMGNMQKKTQKGEKVKKTII